MQKQFSRTVVIVVALLFGGIALLQLARVTAVHSLFPIIPLEEEKVVTSESTEEQMVDNELSVYLQLPDENDQLGQQTIENIRYSLRYGKVAYEEITPDEVKDLTPSPSTVLVLTGEISTSWSYEAVEAFVSQGGGLLIANRFPNTEWNELTGITDFNDYLDSVKGITFEQPIFDGYPDLSSDSTLLTHSILDLEVAEDATMLATVQDEPLLWERPYGEGNVVYWNTTITSEKAVRGLVLQSLSLLPPVMWMNQSGIKIFHIDDFPAPIPIGDLQVALDDADEMTVRDFYTYIWWENMKELSRSFDLPLTGYLIATYEDEFRMKAEDVIANDEYPMLFFGRGILQLNGEIGLHGYNHQSLVTADEKIDPSLGYIPWADKEAMGESLLEADKLFNYYYSNYEIESYVPPSNILNETGIAALHDYLPELSTISALYTGEGDDGGFIQEFGADDQYPSIYHFPRITSGYFDEEEVFKMVDAVANFGLSSHFIHPDDVLDPDRAKGDKWPELYAKLRSEMAFLDETYPYLQGLTQRDATTKWKAYEASVIQVDYREDSLVVYGSETVQPLVGYVRLNDEKQSIETGEFSFGTVEKMEESSSLYRITLTAPSAEIPLLNGN